MKYSLNLVKYVVVVMMCIFSNAFLFAGDCCKRPKQGPPGKQGVQGLQGPKGTSASVCAVVSYLHIPQGTEYNFLIGDPVPFDNLTLNCNVVFNAPTTFSFLAAGTYLITYGVISSQQVPDGPFFELRLNGVSVPNSVLSAGPISVMPIMVVITVAPGDNLQVVSATANAQLTSQDPAAVAFIAFQSISS